MTRPRFLIFSSLVVLLCTACLTVASASPLLEKIEFDATGTNVDRITFKLNSATLPKTFALKGPTRVVFDFPETALTRAVKTNMATQGKFITGIRTAEHRGEKAKTRVVLDLAADQAVDFKQNFNAETNTLVISVFAVGTEPAPSTLAVVAVPEKPAAPAPVAAEASAPARPADALAQGPAQLPLPRDTVATGEASPPIAPEAEPGDQAAELPATAPPKPETAPEQLKDEATVIQPLAEIGPQQDAQKSDKPPVLYSIEFDKNSNRGETINFKLSSFNPPVVFGIEEDTPRIVCFFKDTGAGPQLQDLIDAKGRFVKSIQIGKYSNPDNIRVVLDLVPNKNYDLQQVFFKEDNMFMIIINTTGEKTPGQGS